VSDQPHVFSGKIVGCVRIVHSSRFPGGYQFKFDAGRPLGLIVPEWVATYERLPFAPSTEGTTLYLPLKEALSDLGDVEETLLFLRRLRQLELRHSSDGSSMLVTCQVLDQSTPSKEARVICTLKTQLGGATGETQRRYTIYRKVLL
jgi:hypothetical protein